MQRNVEPTAIFFQGFTSIIRSFTGSSCQCLKTPAALSLLLMLTFYAKSFLILLAYRKQIIKNHLF